MVLSNRNTRMITLALRALTSIGVIEKKYQNGYRNRPTHIVIDISKLEGVTEMDIMGCYGKGEKTAEMAMRIIGLIDKFMFLRMNKHVKQKKQ